MYFTSNITFDNTNWVEIAEPVNVDRTVHALEISGNVVIRFGTDGGNFGIEPDTYNFQFVLPAGVSLWGISSPTSSESRGAFIVTSVGR